MTTIVFDEYLTLALLSKSIRHIECQSDYLMQIYFKVLYWMAFSVDLNQMNKLVLYTNLWLSEYLVNRLPDADFTTKLQTEWQTV